MDFRNNIYPSIKSWFSSQLEAQVIFPNTTLHRKHMLLNRSYSLEINQLHVLKWH